MIKAVIFDVDGVLIQSLEANTKFLQDLLNKAGYPRPSGKEYKAVFHRTLKDVIRILTKSDSEEEIQRIREMGVNREVKYHVELLTSPDKMKKTIEFLSKNYMLGIVTSRIKNAVFEAPSMKEIEKYFQTVLAFEDTIHHKPDPEPLLTTIEKLGILPQEAVYIGDSATDLQAANGAGMRFILFPKSDIEGAAISTNIFSELPQIIERL